MLRRRLLLPLPLALLVVIPFVFLGGCRRQRFPVPSVAVPSVAVFSAPSSAPYEGEIAAEIVQWEIARKKGDPQGKIALRLAVAYVSEDELDHANEVLTQAAKAPDAPDVLRLKLAQTRLSLGFFHEAADALLPLTPRFSTFPSETQQAIVRTFLLAGDAARAAPLLPEWTEGRDWFKMPNGGDWLSLKGLYELTRNRPKQAVAQFVEAAVLSPNDAWNAYMTGLAWRRAGEPERARAAWEQAVNLPSPPDDAKIALAQLYAERGERIAYNHPLHLPTPSMTQRPDYWEAVALEQKKGGLTVASEISRGYALFHGGDPWRAEAVWSAILSKASGEDARELCAALHNSAYKRQDAEAALRWADESLKRFPKDAYFRKRRVEVLLGQNRLAEAERDARKLAEGAPETTGNAGQVSAEEVADLLCRIAVDSGKPDLLAEGASRYERAAPDSPYPSLYRAEWQGQQGRAPENLQKTLELYRQAAKKDPKDPDTQAKIGLLLADLNRPEEAEKTLLHALTLWSRVMDGTPHVRLVQLCQRDGRTSEAAYHAAEYQRLRKIKDGWPTLLKALRQDRPLADWLALGNAALVRQDNWVALCAFRRATQLSPQNPSAWRGLAAVCKRQGCFLPALEASLAANRWETAGN